MVMIQKQKKKKSDYKKHGLNEEIAKIYNTPQWKKLRLAYLMQHPLCEKCLELDEVKEAAEIHHKKPISQGKTLLEMKSLAYDADNLIALCTFHHHQIHQQMKK